MVKQVRAVRTRRALVVAAAETFAREGYALATLPAISRRAGVSAGALHFHFASKDDLAGEVESAAADAVAELVERCRPAAGGARQLLVDAACGLLATVTDPVVRAGFKLGGDPSRRNGPGCCAGGRPGCAAWSCRRRPRADSPGTFRPTS
ncbi:TetR family transcriptional regulator [Streptomyces sp. NPDC002758]